MTRSDGRRTDQLRPVRIRPNFVRTAQGSCLIELGLTRVICTATIERGVPKWFAAADRGWITAEYGMLPASTGQRKPRGRVEGRTMEIQRLVGRSLRAVARAEHMPGLTALVDCDVLQADGGTRCAAVTGGYVALALALWRRRKELKLSGWPLAGAVAAVSVGLVGGRTLLDLAYEEDSAAEVDMNVVMTATGRLVEVQASGEGHTFDERALAKLLSTARKGCAALSGAQKRALPKGLPWPA